VILGRVVGHVVATRKESSHEGGKILRIQPIDPDGGGRGTPFLAFDAFVDAGVGDRVVVTLDGWSAGWCVRRPGAALDAAVIGVVDRIEPAETTPPQSGA